MITVKFSGTGSDCSGLHIIDCTMGFSKASLCDGGIITSVYVSTAVSSISQAYLGGYPIYDSGDCTTCAPVGWYSNLPTSVAYQWDRTTCSWVTQEDCGSRNIMVRESGSSSKSCDGIGILHNVWIDGDNLLEATGMWSNSTLTTTASVPSGRWYQDQQVGQDGYTRYWTNLGNGGNFGNTVLCSGGGGPQETTRYQTPLYFNSFSAANACTGTSVTYWADNQDFSQATTLWTTETGSTFAPNGYYAPSFTLISGGSEVRQCSNGSLSDTGILCGEGEEGPGGFD